MIRGGCAADQMKVRQAFGADDDSQPVMVPRSDKALVAVSPELSITQPVIVYFAPGSSSVVSFMLGPPTPPEPVVVNKLWVPDSAAAVELVGALAPLNEIQPWAVPSSKSSVLITTIWGSPPPPCAQP